MARVRAVIVWSALSAVIAIAIGMAATSPLLAWRQPVYIAAGFAGVLAMALLLVQPMLAGGYLPGLSLYRRRRLHHRVGAGLVLAVTIHVAGLWLTSPPDMIDALTFTSPTPFSAWGVVAMWACFVAGLLAAFRRRLRLRWRTWRLLHVGFVAVTVVGSTVHAMLIDGTMEAVSKAVLCLFVIAATVKAAADLRIWQVRGQRGTG